MFRQGELGVNSFEAHAFTPEAGGGDLRAIGCRLGRGGDMGRWMFLRGVVRLVGCNRRVKQLWRMCLGGSLRKSDGAKPVQIINDPSLRSEMV